MWFDKVSTSKVRHGLDALYPRLWRYCAVLTKSRDLADDLAQAVCLRVLEKAEQYQEGTHIDRWVFRIAQRHWINDLRKNAVRRGAGLVPVEEIDLVDGKFDPQANILGREVLLSVLALPEAQRSVVLLAYVEGYSYKECANILEIPVGTVMSRLAGARAKWPANLTVKGRRNERYLNPSQTI